MITDSSLRAGDALTCDSRLRANRVSCAVCAVRHRMLFADIDVAAAASLLDPVYHYCFEAGTAIYQQGDAGEAIYSIRSGIVKLSLVSREGDIRIVRLVGPGACIGLEALLHANYEHTAEAMSDIDICKIPAGTIKQLAAQQPVLYEGIMCHWHQSSAQRDVHLLKLSTGSVRLRVIHLLDLMAELCSCGNTSFILPGTQDCSALVGARVETVSRVIADLKRNGFLQQGSDGEWCWKPPDLDK